MTTLQGMGQGDVRERAALGKRDRSLGTVACLLAPSPGVRLQDVMVIVQTTDMADWPFGGGIAAPTAAAALQGDAP